MIPIHQYETKSAIHPEKKYRTYYTHTKTHDFWSTYVPSLCGSPTKTFSEGKSWWTVSWYSRVMPASWMFSTPNFSQTVVHRFSFHVTKSSSMLREREEEGVGGNGQGSRVRFGSSKLNMTDTYNISHQFFNFFGSIFTR